MLERVGFNGQWISIFVLFLVKYFTSRASLAPVTKFSSNDSTLIKIPTSNIVNEENWYLEVLSSWLALIELGLIEWFLCTLKKKMSTRYYRGQPLACPRLLVPCSFLHIKWTNYKAVGYEKMAIFFTTWKVLGCVIQSFRMDVCMEPLCWLTAWDRSYATIWTK